MALIAVTSAVYASLVIAVPLSALTGSSRRWQSVIFRSWARAAAAIVKIKIKAEGPRPRPPFLLVSNHLSYVDIVVFANEIDCVFVAKEDVARWPILGRMCRWVGTIFVDRERRRDVVRAGAMIEKAIAEGRGVVLFAEGTSTEGAVVMPFKPALLEQAARADYAVSYAAVSYRTTGGHRPAHLSVCWWGDMPFLAHLWELLQVPEIYATVVFGEETIREPDRKALATKLWQAVAERFTPVVRLEDGL
jgi:1-acyl-sn-glycerol-3-phosphate acyltransferase